MRALKDSIKDITGYDNVIITDRCNTAIRIAMVKAKRLGYDEIIVPDQGGWLSYLKIPEKADLKKIFIKTDFGIIKKKELERFTCKAVILQSIAGYFAHQDMEMIRKVCDKNRLFLIEDISASISERCFGDLVVCSFGRWKLVSSGVGGFIASRDTMNFITDDFSIGSRMAERVLIRKLYAAGTRLQKFYSLQKKVKKELDSCDIVHRERKGINAVAGFSSEPEKEKILKYCKERSYEYTMCPRYIRAALPAVSIELKRQKDL